jgi:hypothetical protein
MVAPLLSAFLGTAFAWFREDELVERTITRKDRRMDLKQEDGIIKYGIAWLLGVPVSVLVLIFLASRAC